MTWESGRNVAAVCSWSDSKKKSEIQYGIEQTGRHKIKVSTKRRYEKNIMYPDQKVSLVVDGLLLMGLQKMASVHLTDDDSDGEGDIDDDDNDGYGM